MQEIQSRSSIWTISFVNVVIVSLAVRMCTQMQNTILPLYVLDQGHSAFSAGLMTTVYTLTALFFRPIAGSLVDKKGRSIIFLIGTSIFVMTSGLYSLAMPLWLLIVIRSISGIGFSWNGTSISTMASDLLPDNRMSEGIGYLGLSQTIAMAIAPGLALSIKDSYGFTSLFTTVFGITFVGLLIGFLIRYEKRNDYIQRRSQELKRRALNEVAVSVQGGSERVKWMWIYKVFEKDAWKPSLLMLFVAISNCAVGTFLAVYAEEKAIVNFGLFYTVSAFMMVIVRLSVGKISMRFGSTAILMPGFILLAVSLIGVVSSSTLTFLLVFAVLYGIAMGALQPEINAMAVMAAAKEHRGAANATFLMMIDIGTGVGAALWGIVASTVGLSWVFILSSSVSIIPFIIYIVYKTKNIVA